jgi:prevent-host-death family protein
MKNETGHDQAPVRFRNRRGEEVTAPAFTATEARNQIARVIETTLQQGVTTITKHDTVKVVLLSMDEFNALVERSAGRLDTLRAEFDAQLTRMQAPGVRKRMQAAFDASPAKLGVAAVKAAAKRR